MKEWRQSLNVSHSEVLDDGFQDLAAVTYKQTLLEHLAVCKLRVAGEHDVRTSGRGPIVRTPSPLKRAIKLSQCTQFPDCRNLLPSARWPKTQGCHPPPLRQDDERCGGTDAGPVDLTI